MIADGYTRLSEDSDRSIPAQKRNIREYAEENGFDLRRIYDDGEYSSGFTIERSEYAELRESIGTEGGPDVIVLSDKRRLVRDINEIMRLFADLREHDVELHTYYSGRLDLSDPVQMAIEVVEGAAAHKEKMQEIEKARDAVQERLENGYDHGRPRFGMQYGPDGRYQMPGEGFETVLRVLAELRGDASFREIASRHGVSSSTVSRIADREDWYLARAPSPDGVETLDDLLALCDERPTAIHKWPESKPRAASEAADGDVASGDAE